MRLAPVLSLVRRVRPPAAGSRVALAAEVLAVGGYLAALAVALLRMASVRLLWFDELFTLHLSRCRSPLELGGHLASGVDLNPPLGYWLTAAATAAFGEVEWAVRLPSVLGALLASACLYLFVRRRRGVAEGLLAAAAVGVSPVVWIYFIEARPYSLTLGLTALALLCWQRAADPETRRRGWLVGLGAALCLGVLSHYYFVVPVAGLAVAELVRSIIRRRVDWPVLAGFAAAGLTLLALYPLWGPGSQQYKAGFWAKVKFTRVAVENAYYGPATKELTIPLAAALAAGAIAGAASRGSTRPGPAGNYPLAEAVALVGVAAGPVIGVAVGAKLAGGYYLRYTLASVVGLSGLLSYAVGRASGPARWGCLVAAAVFAWTGPAGQWKDSPTHFRAEAAAHRATADFLDAEAAGGDVVLESPFEFARLWHYESGRRFVPLFVADPELALERTKADTVDRGLVNLTRAAPAPVVGFDEVLDRLRSGRAVYYYGPKADWKPAELEARGVRFDKVAARPGGTLFRLSLAGK